jgi:catechol 2,3-dioxygenase-like lactoylglutathione lyase family enzyme
MQLDHVALTVADRERSAAFYAEHFGLGDRIHDDPHLLILGQRGGGALLALSEGEVPVLPRTNHFGFRLGDARAVRGVRERFEDAGVPEAEWQDDGGMVRVQVLDPDGYRVDVYAYNS